MEPENSNTFDRFGSSVAFDGDTVVVGDAADFNLIYDVGSATVFERSNEQWMRIARLTNPQNPGAARFGKSVAISGGLMLVGANEDVVDGSHSGAVYAYERINGKWQFTERLIAGDPSSDNFGYSLCMEGDTAIVGSKGDDEFGDASGAAFVFRRINDAWQQVAKLSAQDAAEGDQFGFSVAMSGDLAVIGAPFDDDVASNCGAVYVFRETNGVWAQVAKLLGTDLSANNQFGISVAVDADTIVASTFHFQKIHFHIFETTGNGWEQTGFRQGKGGGLLDFENSVAIHNGRVVVAEARFRH
ncbi:MAG: hypothetical protein KDA71_07785, partial [Planctomycetales bacterium]|nr:hypothetical protein [Planctomycetales bacterium]